MGGVTTGTSAPPGTRHGPGASSQSQVTIAQMEKRTDLLLSTLRHYVDAIGGRLDLVVQFPDQNPVILKQLTGLSRLEQIVEIRSDF